MYHLLFPRGLCKNQTEQSNHLKPLETVCELDSFHTENLHKTDFLDVLQTHKCPFFNGFLFSHLVLVFNLHGGVMIMLWGCSSHPTELK